MPIPNGWAVESLKVKQEKPQNNMIRFGYAPRLIEPEEVDFLTLLFEEAGSHRWSHYDGDLGKIVVGKRRPVADA